MPHNNVEKGVWGVPLDQTWAPRCPQLKTAHPNLQSLKTVSLPLFCSRQEKW